MRIDEWILCGTSGSNVRLMASEAISAPEIAAATEMRQSHLKDDVEGKLLIEV